MGTEILDLYRGIESISRFLLPQEVFLRLQTKSVQCRHRKNPNSLHLMVYAGQMVSLSCMKTTMCPVHMRRESVVQRRWCIVKMKTNLYNISVCRKSGPDSSETELYS